MSLTDIVQKFGTDIDLSSHAQMWRAGESKDKAAIEAAFVAMGKAVADRFTLAVELLRSERNPSAPLRQVAAHAYDAIHHREVQTALDGESDIRTIHVFAVRHNTGAIVYSIVFPGLWLAQAKAAPVSQLGAILYILSQAVDMANGRLFAPYCEKQEKLVARGRAYEALYYRTLLHEKGERPIEDVDVLAVDPVDHLRDYPTIRTREASALALVTLSPTRKRILLTGQKNPNENGVWIAQEGPWTRPLDGAVDPYVQALLGDHAHLTDDALLEGFLYKRKPLRTNV